MKDSNTAALEAHQNEEARFDAHCEAVGKDAEAYAMQEFLADPELNLYTIDSEALPDEFYEFADELTEKLATKTPENKDDELELTLFALDYLNRRAAYIKGHSAFEEAKQRYFEDTYHGER